MRFRTLGCYPLTGAIDSAMQTTLEGIVREMLVARTSERQGRLIDHDESGSMEKKKREGYFLMNLDRRKTIQARDEIAAEVRTFLHEQEHKSMLRFLTCGSVDDGKVDVDRASAVRHQA